MWYKYSQSYILCYYDYQASKKYSISYNKLCNILKQNDINRQSASLYSVNLRVFRFRYLFCW